MSTSGRGTADALQCTSLHVSSWHHGPLCSLKDAENGERQVVASRITKSLDVDHRICGANAARPRKILRRRHWQTVNKHRSTSSVLLPDAATQMQHS
eukprot:5730717-Lingulodinium_polyedra.AAC.1